MRYHLLLVSACVVVAASSVARAQSAECKKTETQAECHDRLKCKADEELDDCLKRLRAGQGGGQQQGNSGSRNDGGNRGGNDGGNRGGNDGGNRGGGNDDGPWGNNNRDSGGGGRDRSNWGDDGGGGGGSRGGRRGGRGGHGGFTANKTFGLGLELGEPTGLNGKYFVAPSGAIDFGLGYIYDHYYYGDGFHLYGDYLWHPTSLASTESFELPLYVGVGLRYWNFNYCYMGLCNYGGSAFGIRVPVGLSFDFNNAPIDIFLEAVPVLDFLNGDYYNRYRDRAHLGIDGSIGFRFWFK